MSVANRALLFSLDFRQPRRNFFLIDRLIILASPNEVSMHLHVIRLRRITRRRKYKKEESESNEQEEEVEEEDIEKRRRRRRRKKEKQINERKQK